MKIGVSLVGISYDHGRDFQHCYQSIKENLIDPYAEDNDVSTYITTYNHELIDTLLDLYKPTHSRIYDYNYYGQVPSHIGALEMLKSEDLDIIIVTRFDIHFNQVMKHINVDYTKFNALFREQTHGQWAELEFVTDNYFVFPHHMIDDYIAALRSCQSNPPRSHCQDLHGVFLRMQNIIGIDKMHIVSPILENSHLNNSFYYVCRPEGERRPGQIGRGPGLN